MNTSLQPSTRGVLRGRRLDEVSELDEVMPGDYWLYPNDRIVGGPCWYICDPFGQHGALRRHDVTEHDDGTITVTPSIEVPTEGGWHGHLERGVWTPA